jgi:Fe-S cluster biogenesis protein NfuA/nitrite reductase/ring-hydroxylating ferredoxin subunit
VEFDRAIAELQTLIETLEREGDERALHLLQLVDALHRPAMERIAAGDLDHPLVQTLVAMYVEEDEEMAAEEALDEVRGYIESHGGDLELLSVEDGVVHVALGGACSGCAASAMTLRRGVEQALRDHMPGFKELVPHAPEREPLLQIETIGPAPGDGLLQIENLRRPVFVEVPAPPRDGLLRAPVEEIDVIVADVGGEIYALRDGCAVDGMSLEGGRLTADGVLVCPWHNCAYDVRSGRRTDGTDGRLAVVPVAVQEGVVKVAVNVT